MVSDVQLHPRIVPTSLLSSLLLRRAESLESALSAVDRLTKVTPVIIEKKEMEVDHEKSSSGEVNEEVTSYFTGGVIEVTGNGDAENDMAKKDKLSQLRQLLEKNLKTAASPSGGVSAAEGGAIGSAFRPAAPPPVVVAAPEAQQPMQIDGDVDGVKPAWGATFPNATTSSAAPNATATAATAASGTLCQRRRVSFNPLVVQDTSNASAGAGGGVVTVVGQASSSNSHHHQQQQQASSSALSHPSPGTRKRHFSFQPISPRQNSLPQSPVASPFISPRSTPVHMLRSRHSSGSALPLHLLPQASKSQAFNSASSDISRAATFGSTSECSTPFISPHGTPVPFNRSDMTIHF